ncbi:type 1 glutamine amidotransferase domain-containing protein [Sphingobium sp. WCS2017Hpa-17]|uniref:type 1 glutamine amidotransferase domain-containing protein n=1 Tax=Sphingobium sp. WCS2017Hpa-17 TaxID=3073638 RepID=UPI0028893000|nr:type 1 glutamine amidotransferase domain-containing protein [Sphingobium sp. WCS2017Hpa-17]
MSKTILFALTAQADLGETGARTGVWLEELATPYQMLGAAGYDILFATPGGHPAPLDPASLEEPWLLPAGHWFLSQPAAMAQLEAPLDIASVEAARIDAIFLVGGTGTLWDFPGCAPLGALATSLIAQDKPVAAICHGVVGLMTATAADGTPLVAGKSLTCFSNEEEAMLEYDKIVPLLAETELVRQGAIYNRAAPFEARVVEDGRLITGQNPASAESLAKALLSQLGVTSARF